MKHELEPKTDQELAELFAVEVAGYVEDRHPISGKIFALDEAWELPEDLEFATSIDALLPHMERQQLTIMRYSYGPPRWNVYSSNPITGDVASPSLARAICITLILIARAEMDEDKARLRSEHPPGTSDER